MNDSFLSPDDMNDSFMTLRAQGSGKVAFRCILGSLTTRLGVSNDSFGTSQVPNESFETKNLEAARTRITLKELPRPGIRGAAAGGRVSSCP
jgi:hypothetical protein